MIVVHRQAVFHLHTVQTVVSVSLIDFLKCKTITIQICQLICRPYICLRDSLERIIPVHIQTAKTACLPLILLPLRFQVHLLPVFCRIINRFIQLGQMICHHLVYDVGQNLRVQGGRMLQNTGDAGQGAFQSVQQNPVVRLIHGLAAASADFVQESYPCLKPPDDFHPVSFIGIMHFVVSRYGHMRIIVDMLSHIGRVGIQCTLQQITELPGQGLSLLVLNLPSAQTFPEHLPYIFRRYDRRICNAENTVVKYHLIGKYLLSPAAQYAPQYI